jgi:antitoxin VapB
MMSLNIKDPEAHKLAQEISKTTGETMTEAVTIALRERIARLRRARKADATAAELLAIGKRCAEQLKQQPLDHGSLLYDEKGLPK